MTPAEFDAWEIELAETYAKEQVEAGRWDPEGALERARDESKELLPQGLETPLMLLLTGVDAEDAPIGRAWVALEPPRTAQGVAFLYDFEVIESRRGEGLGRALLDTVGDAVREAGAHSLELNVFGSNERAISLYASSGYTVVTQQMRRTL